MEMTISDKAKLRKINVKVNSSTTASANANTRESW
jgi:hypothetical protein